MTSDVVLTSALRTNLNSLKNTQSLIDITQAHLSTGKKVNSALDNPQSFFASQSLSNRAGDLTKLLDGIGQSIEVIKAADNGVTALTSLVNQAQAITQSAQTAVSTSSQVASVTGNANLQGKDDLSQVVGYSAGATITFSVSDPTTGAPVAKLDNYGSNTSQTSIAIQVNANDSTDDLIGKINNIVNAGNSNQHVLTASLDSNGNLKIAAANGGSFTATFSTTANTDASNEAFAGSLGFANAVKAQANGASGTNTVGFTASNTATLNSVGLYTAANTLAQGSTLISALKDSANNSLTATNAADTLTLTVGGKTSGDLYHYNGNTGATSTVQSVVDAINHDSTIGSLVNASFDSTTGKISIQAVDSSATDVNFSLTAGTGAAEKFNLGFGNSQLTTDGTSGHIASEDVQFGAASGQLASLQSQYNGIRSQIDSLVTNGDTGYQGTNLLNGDSLVTTFNEERTSQLTTKGANFTSTGLGLKAANFSNAATVNASINQITSALSSIRGFGSGLASDLSVIQTRQTFTNSTINTLQEGSDALVNADQNTESATLLALQTRQSLGVSALSLASQSAQSVLRLFQ